MVEAFPGEGEEEDVAHKAHRAVGEAFTEIDDATAGMLQAEIGALDGRGVNVLQTNNRRSTIEAGTIAEPFMSLAIKVEAIGSKDVTEGADRTTFGVISADGPEGSVLVSFVGAEVDDTPGVEHIVDGAKYDVVTEGGIADHVRDVKSGIEMGELK
jgi:hypothetical protein